MVRTTLGAEVETSVTVAGSESVETVNIDQDQTLPAGANETLLVRPPSGFIYVLLGVKIFIRGVSGASSDTHQVNLQSEADNISVLEGRSSGEKPIEYQHAHFVSATVSSSPTAPGDSTRSVRGIRASDTAGFVLKYFNPDSQDQTSTRQYRLWVRRIQVSG